MSVTVQLFTLVNFTCKGLGDRLSWSVQGNSLTDSIKQDREISVTINNISVDVWSSVLTIRALPINDRIVIGCAAFNENLNFISKGATLIIHG